MALESSPVRAKHWMPTHIPKELTSRSQQMFAVTVKALRTVTASGLYRPTQALNGRVWDSAPALLAATQSVSALSTVICSRKPYIERAQWADTENEWTSAGLGPRLQTQPALTSFLRQSGPTHERCLPLITM